MLNKLALGTAQFGMNYGINNQRGKVPAEEVHSILDEALSMGINTVDTAYLYGDSEIVLGTYKNVKKFKIISKFPNIPDVEKVFKESLERLKIKKIYGYLCHHFEFIKTYPERWKKLLEFKEKGKVKKIGFSLYYPCELEFLLKRKIPFEIVQIPYNIFDRRFEKYFAELKNLNIEIHVRSVFLQGLFFISPEDLPSYFTCIKGKLRYFHDVCKKENIKLSHLLLSFGLSNSYIDKVIIGIDSYQQFKENISINLEKCFNTLKKLDIDWLLVEDEKIVVPSNWKNRK